MTATEKITSPQNEKLKLVRRLASRRGRSAEGLFVTEGEDLLYAGLGAGALPRFVLVPDDVSAVGANDDFPVIVVARDLLDAVTSLGSGTRALAAWEIPSQPASIESGPCIYLQGVGDPGNVGAIVRSATALGGARVALGPECADPWAPKATRATMGSLFSNPPVIVEGVEQTPAPRLGLSAHGAGDLDSAIASLQPATICLGAEREGLGEATLAACDGLATIPIEPGAESLNVAATAAISLHRISSTAPGHRTPGRPPESSDQKGAISHG